MSSKYFVQLSLGEKSFKDKVSAVGCADVADFKTAIKNTFHSRLARFDNSEFTLFDADGTTEIDPMTPMNDVFVTPGKPLIVKVEPAPPLTISARRHRDYKHSKAIHSSRSLLTSIALSVEAEYELEKRERDKPATFGDVLWNMKNCTPTPKPPNTTPLHQLFTNEEWLALDALNVKVNNNLHLPLGQKNGVIDVILPSEFDHQHQNITSVAKKAKLVREESNLVVKDELSESGGESGGDATSEAG